MRLDAGDRHSRRPRRAATVPGMSAVVRRRSSAARPGRSTKCREDRRCHSQRWPIRRRLRSLTLCCRGPASRRGDRVGRERPCSGEPRCGRRPPRKGWRGRRSEWIDTIHAPAVPSGHRRCQTQAEKLVRLWSSGAGAPARAGPAGESQGRASDGSRNSLAPGPCSRLPAAFRGAPATRQRGAASGALPLARPAGIRNRPASRNEGLEAAGWSHTRGGRRPLAKTLLDLLAVARNYPRDVWLAHAVQVVDAPLELVQSGHGGFPIPLKLTVGVSVVTLSSPRSISPSSSRALRFR
jgi:hypothetical protein